MTTLDQLLDHGERTTTMTTLDQLLDHGESFVRQILLVRREKVLVTMYHLMGPDKDVLIPCEWQNDIQKQFMVLEIKKIARDIGATSALFIGEAWMRVLSDEERERGDWTPPSESPDRVEVVQLVATDGITVRERSLRMVRDKRGKITDLITQEDHGMEIGGRLIDGIIPAPPRTIH